jgi:hypothetical protein
MENMIDKLKPSWKFRRVYIALLLIFLSICIATSLGGAIWLGANFTPSLSAFMIVFVICNFMALLGIIGSYIFGSRWETKDFLDVLPNIIPHTGVDVTQNSGDGMSVQDMIQGNK